MTITLMQQLHPHIHFSTCCQDWQVVEATPTCTVTVLSPRDHPVWCYLTWVRIRQVAGISSFLWMVTELRPVLRAGLPEVRDHPLVLRGEWTVNSIPTINFWFGIPIDTLLLTDCAWEFQNDLLWDTLKKCHILLSVWWLLCSIHVRLLSPCLWHLYITCRYKDSAEKLWVSSIFLLRISCLDFESKWGI